MAVLDWLLDSDPAIRWQVLRDLLDAPPEEVAAERARVATEGWGAQLLAARDDDGQWAGGACFPAGFEPDEEREGQPWTPTLPTLHLLTLFGLDPDSAQARETVALVQESCRWEHDDEPFFAGEVEECINGRLVTIGASFGVDMGPLVERLLGDQFPDGGWNCWRQYGYRGVSSFDSTINVLEGLLAHEQVSGGTDQSRAARQRGEEHLLERRLFRRKTTGEVAVPSYLDLRFPPHWHHDVLRGLDYFRSTGAPPDQRLDDALELVRSKQQEDGTWLLDGTHPGDVWFEMEQVGQPSRWNTLRALRVLRWADDASPRA